MSLRPKTFAAKLLLLFFFLVAAAQVTTGIIVARNNRAQARRLIEADLRGAARAFTSIVQERNALLVAGASTATRDFVLKTLFARGDYATLASGLPSIQRAINSDIVAALTLDGALVAATSNLNSPGDVFTRLVAAADADPSPNPTATGYGYLDGTLYSIAIAPLRAPDIIGWMAIGFKIDHAFAAALKAQTAIDVTFIAARDRPLASTLPPRLADELMAALPPLPRSEGNLEFMLGQETALAFARRLDAGPDQPATLVLQFSLDEKLRPAREAEQLLLLVTLGSLILAVILSLGFARRLAQPIVELVGHTRRIATGDYETRIGRYRSDELGRLAEAFDQMSAGLAERDRVRDLLDKNVSPAVAAQLLRDGAALGGEEREVTILFSDLRGFTTLSEKLPARDLVTLLNRYLDRMSPEIERQGGVIDKYVGDSIMALFGAPVALADAADRAVAAARAMESALRSLNQELAAEGHAPLAAGIGINTARVIAGNMGSQRRRNYSVLGDGVNVAARLQSLTRTPEYQTNIVISAATVAALRAPGDFSPRPLGSVHVKGRAQPVDIFAL